MKDIDRANLLIKLAAITRCELSMQENSILPITPRGTELNLSAARPFEAIQEARTLLRTARLIALGTIDPESGYPYTMATNVAIEPDGTPFFFVARLAIHARNIEADNRVSLSFAEAGAPDALMRPRLTLVGRANVIPACQVADSKERYAYRYPKAKLYLNLPDAQLYRVRVEALQINGGPAQNANDVTALALKTDLAGTDDLMSRAKAEIDRLNRSPGEISRLAASLGKAAGTWRVSGLDPEGIELSTGRETLRYWFSRRVTSVDGLADQLACSIHSPSHSQKR